MERERKNEEERGRRGKESARRAKVNGPLVEYSRLELRLRLGLRLGLGFEMGVRAESWPQLTMTIACRL